MNIEKYNGLLKLILSNHRTTPYVSEDGGLVYIGPPNFNFKFETEIEKQYFVNFLCMFTTFDMKVYNSFGSDYQLLKSHISTPKFEYGLTGTFYYPEKIFTLSKIPLNEKILIDCFVNYNGFITKTIKEMNITFSISELYNAIILDQDINIGVWGKRFCRILDSSN